MRTSEPGVRLIKKHEGYRGRPYFCPAGKPTIGYGATLYPDGRPVSMTDPAISEAEASRILVEMLGEFEAAVVRLVTVPIEQHQFDALVSFAYNLGPTQLANSTLLRKLNAGDKAATVELPASLGTGWKQVFGEPEASGSATFPKVGVPMQAGRVWVRNSK